MTCHRNCSARIVLLPSRITHASNKARYPYGSFPRPKKGRLLTYHRHCTAVFTPGHSNTLLTVVIPLARYVRVPFRLEFEKSPFLATYTLHTSLAANSAYEFIAFNPHPNKGLPLSVRLSISAGPSLLWCYRSFCPVEYTSTDTRLSFAQSSESESFHHELAQ